MQNKDNNKTFIEACKKAGLAVQGNTSSQIKKGIIISDAKGKKYTVDSDGELKRITPANIDLKAIIATNQSKVAISHRRIKPQRFGIARKPILRMASAKKGKIKFQND